MIPASLKEGNNMDTFLPLADALPLPAPVWLFQFLLILTFIGHVIFMNCALGGTIIAAFCMVKGRNDPGRELLAKKIFTFMPVVIAFTVTLGVAPLLFAQALYGHLLYTSSILMAFAWFAVVPLAIAGYYLAYTLRFRWQKLGNTRKLLTVVTAAAFAIIGFIYVNNMTLMLRPESWGTHYFQNSAAGMLNWSDMQVYPRYLHMLLGAIAVTGVWITITGARRKSGDEAWSKDILSFGSKIFVYATLANIAVGIWFLLVHPKRIMMIFMGQNIAATILLAASTLAMIGALILIHKAGRAEDGRKLTYLGAGHVAAVLVMMAVMRDQLRQAYLEPYFSINQLQVEPQWGVFGLFAVTLVAGLAALAWMMRAHIRAGKTGV